jgi:dTDP-4-amino-4,6-dideoxygalactose transaminase
MKCRCSIAPLAKRRADGENQGNALGKKTLDDLVIFGGEALFDPPRSASSLAKPDLQVFLRYSKQFNDARWFSNSGPVSVALEQRLAEFHRVDHCVTFSSGFWALVIAMRLLALPGRSEVVIPSLTYRRMADAVNWAGLVPTFCEVSPENLAVTAEAMSIRVGRDTALLLPVHPIVNSCDVKPLEHLALQEGLPLLFDSVESCYETVDDRKVGECGDAEIFSLHASKLINGLEGGYLTTNSTELAAEARLAGAFGFTRRDQVVSLGMNAKLNEVHAAMAMASLEGLDTLVEHNQGIYEEYRLLLPNISGVRLVEFDARDRTSFKNIVVELTDDWPINRASLLRVLHAEGVLARPYYSPALHQRHFDFPTRKQALPVTDFLEKRFLLLPSGSRVSVGDVRELCDLLEFISANHRECARVTK